MLHKVSKIFFFLGFLVSEYNNHVRKDGGNLVSDDICHLV